MIGTEFSALRIGPPVSDRARLEASAKPIATPIMIETMKELTTAVTVATALMAPIEASTR